MSSNENIQTTTPEPIVMTREAVTGRLEVVRALYKLGVSLLEIRIDEAKPVNPRTR